MIHSVIRPTMQFCSNWAAAQALRLHHDQRGSISIASVFAFIFLAMLLGLVMNIGKHADRKVRMQNGADAATFSGGVMLARSMNTIAFTNHLLCDVFAMTAYLREARDRDAEAVTVPVFEAWEQIAEVLEDAPVDKFSRLAPAIRTKIRLEQNLIEVFGRQNQEISERLLPVMETILFEEMIPQFQTDLVLATPGLTQQTVAEIAARHCPATGGLSSGQDMLGVMWRTDGFIVNGATETERSTVPAVDPVRDVSPQQPTYFRNAVRDRVFYSALYLNRLNTSMLRDFPRTRKAIVRPTTRRLFHTGMSQYFQLWLGATRAELKQLLEIEYPDRNLPFQLRANDGSSQNDFLDEQYMFIGVAYWGSMQEQLPGLFQNPLDADDLTFAQVRIAIPISRPVWRVRLRREQERSGFSVTDGAWEWFVGGQGLPTFVSLMNQNWSAQLVPATSPSVPFILETQPPETDIDVPDLGGITVDEFRRINTH